MLREKTSAQMSAKDLTKILDSHDWHLVWSFPFIDCCHPKQPPTWKLSPKLLCSLLMELRECKSVSSRSFRGIKASRLIAGPASALSKLWPPACQGDSTGQASTAGYCNVYGSFGKLYSHKPLDISVLRKPFGLRHRRSWHNTAEFIFTPPFSTPSLCQKGQARAFDNLSKANLPE